MNKSREKLFLARRLTCVCRAGVEQSVCVGDKLQLSVQVRQQDARQGHAHCAITFDFHPVHLCRHVQRSQCGSEVYLRHGGYKSRF